MVKVKKLIVLLLLVFFLFGCKSSSGDFESSNFLKNCKDYIQNCKDYVQKLIVKIIYWNHRDYISYCTTQTQKPFGYCVDIVASYITCQDRCEMIKLPHNFCKKACSWDFSLRWKFYWMDDSGAFFYDLEDITWLPEKVARVWLKMIPTEKEKEKWIRELGEIYEKIDFYLGLVEIDCAARKIRGLDLYAYSSDGTLIGHATSYIDWKPIVPESSDEVLFNEVRSKKDK